MAGITVFTYTGNVTLPETKTFTVSETVQGHLFVEGIPNLITFGATTSVPSPVTTTLAQLTAIFSVPQGQAPPSTPPSITSAVGTFSMRPDWINAQSPILNLISDSTQSSPSLSSTGEGVTSTTGPQSVPTANSTSTNPLNSTQPTSASHTNTPQPKQERYGVGHLVGTAVGCLIGGALLATVALFLFMRRRWRNGNDLSEPVREKSALNGHGGAVYVAGSRAWECHLPQSESDGTIRAMAERTLDQIEMHVENFYKDAANVHLGPEVQSKITELDSRHLPSPVLSLLPQSNRPTVLIKHCIGNLVISRIAAAEATAHSFLPKDFHSPKSSSTVQSKPAFTQALSSWRVLTAYLSVEPEHDHAYQEERDQSIADAAQLVCQAFGPWARSTDTEKTRSQNLVGIMKRASELGTTLFSQPSTFEWQWQRHAQGREVPISHDSTKIVVLPGLYKTSDQSALEIAPPMCVIEPRFGAF